MSEDARSGVRASGNFLEVGATNAAGVHPDQHFTGSDRRHRDSLEAYIVDASVDGGLHCCRDYIGVGFDSRLTSNGHEVILDDVGKGFGANADKNGGKPWVWARQSILPTL